MDRYGQIGPEKPDYDADVLHVAERLQQQATVGVALTHRFTRQYLVLSRKDDMSLMTAPAGCGEGEWVFVAVEGRGAYWFRVDFIAHVSYVGAKLGIDSEVDAQAISDFLRDLGVTLGHRPSFGASTVTAA